MCFLDTPIVEVIATIMAARVHRIYVVDSMHPLGIISITDILNYVLYRLMLSTDDIDRTTTTTTNQVA